MESGQHIVNWKVYTAVSLVALVAVTVVAFITKLWVLTAIPVGFLFGFFLQKGDLCGSSAFSEVIMMRDTRKVAGLWILIVTAMIGFAVIDLLGLVKLNPKPMIYLNYIVGGVIFGVGMVLAGGCISGCLYKGASGNFNSIVALLTVPVGVMMVEFGPLNGFQIWMKEHIISASGGGRLSLPALTGIPFWSLATIFAVGTLAAVLLRRKRISSEINNHNSEGVPALKRIITKPWRPWAAGLAIGLLMVPAYISSASSGRNYPLGVTHGVMQAELLVIDSGLNNVYAKKPPVTTSDMKSDVPLKQDSKPSGKKVVWWLVATVISLMLGSWVSARLSGQARLLPKPPDEMLVAILGGLLIGVGAALAGGCVVGNIMSGWALMSVGTVLFGVVVVLSNWATTYLYMMGGQRK